MVPPRTGDGARYLMAEFTAKAGCEGAVGALLAGLTPAVRDEPGNLVFDPFTRADHPRVHVVVEAYRDDAAFRDHISSEHSRAFNAALADLVEGGASELTWLSPLPEHPAVPGAAARPGATGGH